jgi:hypothetical protein
MSDLELRQAHRFLKLKTSFDECMRSRALRTCLKTVAEIQARKLASQSTYHDSKMRAAHMEHS